ncbi:MAG: hypothetical protein CO118_07810 [Flavobacteriales bacterium CG_4_9_14_3_um_filter_32_8]|nr:MAG: hypothetical protein CO118_07810 [Flavobacteriales bacterium CG_4_9_14_3_um_filter_32_8]
METWQINLSLIPSIAVILTSSNRMALGLTDEINSRLTANVEVYKEILPNKIKQLKRLSISILLMYISLSILILNALLVGIDLISEHYDKLLIFISIIIFFVAIYFSTLFSWNAYFIRQKQFEKFKE